MIAKGLLLTAALTLVSSDLPPGAEGRWAATPAACASGPSVEMTPSAVVLRSGARTRRLGALDYCLSCFGGARSESSVIMIRTGYEQPTEVDAALFLYDSAEQTMTPDFRDNPDRSLNRTYPLQDVVLKRCRS
jgi:hypothetical protein